MIDNDVKTPCRSKGADPELWHSTHPADVAAAKEACASCPVMEQCRQLGFDGDEYGTWGGLTRLERRQQMSCTICDKPAHVPRTRPAESQVARCLEHAMRRTPKSPWENEQEVIALINNDCSVREMAAVLGLNPRTVSRRLNHYEGPVTDAWQVALERRRKISIPKSFFEIRTGLRKKPIVVSSKVHERTA